MARGYQDCFGLTQVSFEIGSRPPPKFHKNDLETKKIGKKKIKRRPNMSVVEGGGGDTFPWGMTSDCSGGGVSMLKGLIKPRLFQRQRST